MVGERCPGRFNQVIKDIDYGEVEFNLHCGLREHHGGSCRVQYAGVTIFFDGVKDEKRD